MSPAIRLAIVCSMVVPSVACDQATKIIAARLLASGPIEFFGGLVQFRLVHNTGAFLSLGAQLPEWLRDALFLGLVPLLLAFAVFALIRSMEPTRTALVGTSLILSGGLGNFIDRTLHDGGVVDFVSIGFSGLRTGIFNVADVAIIAGVLMVMWVQRKNPAEDGIDDDARESSPADSPTISPTISPTVSPTDSPTDSPTISPTTISPTPLPRSTSR